MRVQLLGFDDLDRRLAYALWRLRQQVFVVEQACPYPDLDGRDIEPATRHLLLTDDLGELGDPGRLVGCLRLLEDGDAARIGRVVVAPAARGRGLADLLVRTALEWVGRRRVRLDAQTGLAHWYAGHGFTVTGPEFYDDGVAHLPMERPGS